MRFGVIAYEFPPERGGMQEHARGVVTWLAERCPVTVFTTPGRGVAHPNVQIIDRLDRRLEHDARLLQGGDVDVFLALSAGATAFAPFIKQPLFGYVHGHDAMTPWSPHFSEPKVAQAALTRIGLAGKPALERRRRRAIGKGFAAARGLFANSAATAAFVKQAYPISNLDFIVVHPGVDEAFLQFRPHAPSASLRLLSIARLSKNARRKNIDRTIQAVAALAPSLDITYEIVGGGDDLERLKAMTSELGVGHKVRFSGDLDEDGIREAYARSDLFILVTDVGDSRRDIEGFGMVYAEAACSGVPVLASRQGGVAEAVADGVSGILLSDGSASSIASGVSRFIANRNSFSVDAIREHGRRLTSPVTSKRLYDEVLARLGGDGADLVPDGALMQING